MYVLFSHLLSVVHMSLQIVHFVQFSRVTSHLHSPSYLCSVYMVFYCFIRWFLWERSSAKKCVKVLSFESGQPLFSAVTEVCGALLLENMLVRMRKYNKN